MSQPFGDVDRERVEMSNLGLTALILNRRQPRLKESGLLIFSIHAGRAIMRGNTPMSQRLQSDFERAGEYYIEANHGRKTVFWLPNKLSNFFDAAQGYYGFGGYSLWKQELSFEPDLALPCYITDDFFLTNESYFGVETIKIVGC